MSGTGSTWSNAGCLYVGDGTSGTSGTLTISGGGNVTVGLTTFVGPNGSSGTLNFGPRGGTLTTGTLAASPSQLAGTGTINANGLISDIDLRFDATHGLKQTLTFKAVVMNLDLAGNPGGNWNLGAGYQGYGTLTIQDGITVSSTGGGSVGYVGYRARVDGHSRRGRQKLDVGDGEHVCRLRR